MTSHERLLAALRGQSVDRVPVWLLFPYHTTGYYVDVRTNPCYVPIFEKSKQYAVMLDRRNPRPSLFAPEVQDREDQGVVDGWQFKRRTLSYGGRQLVSETRHKGNEIVVKKLLETEADLDVLLTFPVNDDPQRIHEELDRQALQYFAERGEFPIEYGAMMLDLGEPIGFLYHNSNLEEYALWSLSCSDKVVAFLDRAMRHYRLEYEYWLRRDAADVYFLVGSELASPPLVSRKTFQRWIVPYARELIAMIHGHGKLAIQHYHGQIKQVLPDFLTMGPDALHTIESPPTGNCTLTDAFEVVGDRITLIGNIQYDLFRSLTPQQMREEVARVLAETRGRRFILSPTAGPYEEQIPQRMIDNYLAFLDAGWELGAQ
jgi:hypothetical protein